ncbi:MAG: hypothetical protein ACTTKO_04640 [Candidatus Limimorpha sp.]
MAFFYRHKPKKFNYIPRYYDPDKESWEQKKAAQGMDTKLSHEEQLRLQMRKRWGRASREETKAERRQKTLRAFVLVAIVVIMFYFIFCTPLMTNLVSGLMGK